MRNLKKFLALALAMVMAFSLMLSASAADQVKDWTDKDEVTKEFTKAVDVLSGMEIFQGDDKGFRPGDSITRAEVAALVYRAATGDVANARTEMYRTYAPFTDVKSDDWFAGYVGYCWNAGYIKGETATRFNPYAPVTGYEVLAMILRAVGYDKNHEFEGGQWIVNVASISNDKKVTKDVKSTIYGDTLHGPARRDVVASLLFNAIQLKTVTYTPALGYETDRVGASNKSLGELWFNLKKVTDGIIVGNQDTGETSTIVNKAKSTYSSYYSYFYNTKQYLKKTDTTKTEVADSYEIDAKTGIDMFGHKVEVYFNEVSGKTFALYDNVKKSALVTATGDPILSISTWSAATQAPLGEAARDAGFKVDLKNDKAVFNQSFQKSGTEVDLTAAKGAELLESDYNSTGKKVDPTAKAADEVVTHAKSASSVGNTGNQDYPLYLVISNNDALTVDMIVALNVNVSRISQVNNYGNVPTVTVTQYKPESGTAGANTPLSAAWNDKKGGMIDQKSLTATSDKALDTPVVGVAIVGTQEFVQSSASLTAIGSTHATASTSRLWYRLSKPTTVVEGTVTNYANNADHTGSVIIDGKKYERSLLADAITGYDYTEDSGVAAAPAAKKASRGIVPYTAATQNAGLSPDAGKYGKYRLYLDAEGKYIWAEPLKSSEFVYGTYIDYSTGYATGSYEYTLVGVNLEGEQVKKVVTSYNGTKMNAAIYGTQVAADEIPDVTLGLPFRDNGNAAATGAVSPSMYRGFMVTEAGALTGVLNAAGTGAYNTGDGAANGYAAATTNVSLDGSPVVRVGSDILAGAATTPLTIDSDAAKLGMKATYALTGAAGTPTKYFTNSTKFIVVSGAGTDTQKVKVYNGMTELLDGAGSVTINTAALTANKGALKGTGTVPTLEKMVYYTQSPFTYASVDNSQTFQVDTIFLPEAAISRQGQGNLVFVGNDDADSMTKVGKDDMWLYTLYKNGEAGQYWLDDDAHTIITGGTVAAGPNAGATGGTGDAFYELEDTGNEMPDGSTIWTVKSQNGATKTCYVINMSVDGKSRPNTLAGSAYPVVTKGTYTAATYSAQTATMNPDADTIVSATDNPAADYNVSNAKVVNLNAKNPTPTWPTITDLASLNDAASTGSVYAGKLPKVAALVDPANPMNVLVIYVCYAQ